MTPGPCLSTSRGTSSAKCLVRYSLNSLLSRPVTIENVSDDVLQKIFRYFLDVSPRNWPTLVHTCRTCRHIVFESQQALHLRLFCTHGTHVLKSLYCWPALPIVVQYGGSLEDDLPTQEDEDNIMAAFNQPHRVIFISLTVTAPLQERLSTIESSFSELEHLVLLSQDGVRRLIQPRGFRWGQWGTRLRSLHLTKIALPGLPQLLFSSRNLVDLQLHEVLDHSSISTEFLTIAFSGMTQLRSLSLHILPPFSTSHFLSLLPPMRRVALPSLTRFHFRGITSFLKGLVAGIDAPRLGDIEVTFPNESIFDLSELIEFIDRIKMHKSPRRADILSSEHNITISLTQPGAHTRFRLKLLCEPLTAQLSSMALICIEFSAFLFNVEDLRIHGKQPSLQGNGPYDERWLLETVNSFKGVKWLQISGNLSCNVVKALQRRHWRRESVLPALHKLHVRQRTPCDASLREAIVALLASRRLFGHHIAVEYGNVLHSNKLRATGTVHSHDSTTAR